MAWFVSPTGNDSGSGTQGSPFKTIQRAQEAVRTAKKDYGMMNASVNLMPGTYSQESSLRFQSQDSGWPGLPIMYQSAHVDDPAIISGGMQLTDWKDAGNGLWAATVPSTAPVFRQMWVNGGRRTLARTPMLTYEHASTMAIQVKAGDLPTVTSADIGTLSIVLYESWTASIHQVSAVDAANNTVWLATAYNPTWANSAAGARYYFQNSMALLDEEGEFYFNASQSMVFYKPFANETLDDMVAVVPQVVELVQGFGHLVSSGAAYLEHVRFHNIAFQHTMVDVSTCFTSSCDGQSASFLTSAALRFNMTRNVTLSNVTVAHVGGYAVWFNRGTVNNTMRTSVVTDVGAGAVRLGPPQSGVEATPALRSTHNVITNNVLQDGGHFYQEGCGVLAQQVANTTITHNVIRYFRYTGVSIGWTWGYAATSVGGNLVGWNLIHDIGMHMLSDMGCVYSLGIQPGTRIVNNVCHDVWSFNYGGWGFYTDEGSSHIVNSDNVVYHTKCAGYHQHYGLGNTMENNIISDVNVGNCDGALRSSQHPGVCKLPAKGENQGRCSSFSFNTNIITQLSGPIFMSTIPTGFQNMSFANNTYYRQASPSTIVFPMSTTFAAWKAEGKDVLSIIQDPKFLVPWSANFTLSPSSPAEVVEHFRPIDLSNVGPQPW